MQGRFTIVEYYGEGSGHRCGYCKSSTSNYSHGLWAHCMTVQDYQDLINRGWRRSGHYCYKPNNAITCCPLYTIKCDALNFKMSKSHKKIMKRMNKFLRDGKKETDESGCRDDGDGGADCGGQENFQQAPSAPTANLENLETFDLDHDMGSGIVTQPKVPPKSNSHKVKQTPSEINRTCDTKYDESNAIKPKTQTGPDPGKAPCKKAKQLRLERKLEKLAKRGQTSLELNEEKNKLKNMEKSLEDFLNEQPNDGVHKLKLKILPSSRGVSDQVVELYKKYQVTVHNDPPSKITKSSFSRFLCESPLELTLVATQGPEFDGEMQNVEYKLFEKYQIAVHDDPPSGIREFLEFLVLSPMKVTEEEGGPSHGYGSFHQQYWLDNKLIAVAVIDILPECVSSVYFFYDPDYRFLSLGTYASLQELALTRRLQKIIPRLSNYYMGFYIHSCPKMRYKGKLVPSYLLCPEVYTWHLLDDSIRNRLDENKYQRFNSDPSAQDANQLLQDEIFSVKVLYGRSAMFYGNYLEHSRADDMEEVFEYGSLVGKTCAKRMLLYRS